MFEDIFGIDKGVPIDIRPWYVRFSFDVCRSPILEEICYQVSYQTPVRHLFTTTKLFHAPSFAWGKSVLHKQVIV